MEILSFLSAAENEIKPPFNVSRCISSVEKMKEKMKAIHNEIQTIFQSNAVEQKALNPSRIQT